MTGLRLPRWRMGATFRIALGLVSLVLGLVLVLDLVFKLLPNPRNQQQAVREQVAIGLAVQARTLLADAQSRRLLAPLLQGIQRESGDIASIGVRSRDGTLVAATAGHAQWQPPAGGLSTLTHVVVPLLDARGTSWGAVEVRFADRAPHTLLDWLQHPTVLLLAALGGPGFIAFYLYLRRMLQHLDPTQAIPERVRAAFDTLTEGLLVLDAQGRVLLANQALRRLHPRAAEPLLGRRIEQLDWLVAGLPQQGPPPWTAALQSPTPVLGLPLTIEQADGAEPRRAMLNCAAIRDAGGTARGCLLTLDDVTELDRANARLRHALAELEQSRDQIQRQNDELTLLANCDPMTGCFNRRAFFSRAEVLLQQAQAQGTPLACLMTDIDRFKTFNDTHGHAVGDLVIQQVAKILRGAMRNEDLLCRYGGEEFCILLPATDLDAAASIAERIRSRIEREAGPGVRSIPGLRITSSFGVAILGSANARTILQLIERADQGLYAAKEAGRNQVQCIDWGKVEALVVEG